jgi:hypothetical protein
MANEVRTDVLITAKTQGFTQAQQEAAKVAKDSQKALEDQVKGFTNMSKSAAGAKEEIGRLEGTLQSLTAKQAGLNRTMEELGDTSAPAYKKLNDQLRETREQATRVHQTLRQLKSTFQESAQQQTRAMAQGGFTQGLLQGAMPGLPFLQRGPGMGRQVMGMAAGRTMRGVGGGLMGTPFTGAQSLIGALQSIPFVGGAMAAPIARSMQQAQQTIQADQVRMQTAPFLGGPGMQLAMNRAGRRAYAGADVGEARLKALSRFASPEYQKAISTAGQDMARESIRRHVESIPESELRKAGRNVAQTKEMLIAGTLSGQGSAELRRRARVQAKENLDREIRGEAYTNEIAVRKQAARTARAQVRRRHQGNIAGEGLRLMGAAMPQAMQFAAQVAEVGGGSGLDMQNQGMLRTSMAAQTAFGIGGGVSGAFLQAGRRGGLAGAQGTAGDALASSIGDALRQGLEGSEVRDYLQQMASGITQWKSTGIPVNKQAIAGISAAAAGMGLGGVRGMAFAGGITRAAEGISRSGPQNVGQLMMIQALTGLKPGRASAEQLEDALIKLEKKQFGKEEVELLITNLLAAGGGGAEGRRVAFSVLSQAGIGVSREEVKLMDKAQTGNLSAADKKRLSEIQGQRDRGSKLAALTADSPDALARTAAGMVPGSVKAQAALQNQQIATGRNMVKSLHNLEKTAQGMTKKITDMIGPVLEKFTGNLEELTKVLTEYNSNQRSNLGASRGSISTGKTG